MLQLLIGPPAPFVNTLVEKTDLATLLLEKSDNKNEDE